jgi:hypothetical protein
VWLDKSNWAARPDGSVLRADVRPAVACTPPLHPAPHRDGLEADEADARHELVRFTGQQCIQWPEKDGLWVLVPIVDAVAKRPRADKASELS